MKKITTSAGVFGPYVSVEATADRYVADGVELPFSVIAVGTISDVEPGDFPEPEPEPPTALVPAQITRAQGKAALIIAGLWSGVLAFVAAIEDETERALADVALNDTLTWERSSPFLNAAAAGLGVNDAQLDALFIQAKEIQL